MAKKKTKKVAKRKTKKVAKRKTKKVAKRKTTKRNPTVSDFSYARFPDDQIDAWDKFISRRLGK